MANGSYIGKISALVTASTSDLSRKLRGAAQDVDRFGNSVRAQFDRASRNAENSLNQIFTPLQRLQRALTAGRSATLNILKPEDVRRLQQSVSLAEQINKPLASAARAFQNLSADAAGAFAPALVRAQEAAVQLSNTLAETGSVGTRQFNEAQRAVEQTSAAIQRLNSLQRASAAGLTGNEAQFVNPRALAEINAAAAASQRAGALPVSQREDSGLRERVRQLAQFRQQVVAAASQVESLELSPDVDQTALESARRRLEQIIETTRRARVELDDITVRAGGGQPPDQRRAAENEIALLQRREQTAKQAEQAAAAAAQRAADNEIALLQRREQAARDVEEQRLARVQRAADDEVAIIIRREQAALEAEQRRVREAAVPLGDRLAEQGRRRVESLTGDVNIGSAPRGPNGFSAQAQRDIDALGSRVGAVREQLERLPNAIRTRFVPELQRAQAQLVSLQNAPNATVRAIETATRRVERLEAAARRASAAFDFRQSFGGAGLRGIEEGLNQQALRGYTAQLQVLQQALAGTSQEARGPAVAAFDRLRNAIATAMENGTLETEQTRRVIRQLTQDASRATAAAAGIGERGLSRRLQRAGDIGRGSFGNLSLGIQQAAFAIDDFFSVTGGLDQRIRAAGNNISQLGFVLGGTTGLIVGIAASITSQLIAALIKWNSNGVETEDRVNALNDALARQKSLVEDLAQAYESIADAISRSGFSSQTQELRNQSKAIDELRKKQDEQIRERIVANDPDVLREREFQASRERQIEESQSIEERVRLRRQIEASRRREEEATRAAVDTPGLAPGDVAFLVGRPGLGADAAFAFPGATEAQLRDQEARGFPGSRFAADRQRQVQEERQALLDRLDAAGSDGERRQIALDAISQEERRIEQQILDSGLSEDNIVNQQRRQALEELEQQRQQLEKGFLQQVNEITTQSLTVALRASESIGQSIELISSSLNGGSSQVQAALEAVNQRILNAAEELEEAQKTGDVDRATAAQEEIDAAQRLAQELASTARSVASFADALDRVSGQLLNTVVNEARSAENQARREANRAGGTFELGGMPRQEARARAERDAQRARSERQRIEDFEAGVSQRNRELVAEFEQEQLDGRPGGAAARFIRDRDAAQAEINRLERERDEAIKSGDSEAARRASREIEEQEERRRAAQRGLDREFENSEQGQEARRNADFVDRQRQNNASFQQELNRGRELQLSPAERAGRELARDLRALEIAFEDDGGGNRQEFEADRQRIIDEALRSTAPAIFALTDSVLNAVLAGPSRAALQATDVSSVQGSAELNRLLRGEDAGRDQNLVELRRQSKALEELVREVKDNDVDIAN